MLTSRREQERALLGAALLDDEFARLLLAEVADGELTDPTCALALWAMRRGSDPDEPRGSELDVLRHMAYGGTRPGWFEPPNGVDRAIQELAGAGLLDDAGGAEAVTALVDARPALWQALRAARETVDAVVPIEEEPVVEFARALLGSV